MSIYSVVDFNWEDYINLFIYFSQRGSAFRAKFRVNAHNRVEVTRLSELSLFSNCDSLLFLISIFLLLKLGYGNAGILHCRRFTS